jgi:hypothetical protein
MSLVFVHDPFNPNVSLVSKVFSAYIHQQNMPAVTINIIICNHMYICHINNIQTLTVHSLTRSGVQGVSSMARHPLMSRVLHTQENPINNTHRCKYNKNNISSNHQYLIIIIKTTNRIMTQITCTQVSSKNKFAQCAQERDVTYTHSCFKLHPEVSQYVSAEIKCLTISYV